MPGTTPTRSLAVVAAALLDSREWGSEEEVRIAAVWEAIEAVISREELQAAVAIVSEMVPPPDAEGTASSRP